MAVSKGDTVKVEYTGKFKDGTVFDSTEHGDHAHPLEFKVGEGQVIPGFENAVKGMKKGEEKSVTLKPEEGYGDPDPKLVQQIPKEQIPNADQVKKGQTLMVALPTGQQLPVKVKEVADDTVTLDMNHPLAGKELHFDIKIVDVE